VGVLGAEQILHAGGGCGARPDQRQQPALQRALVQLDAVADAEATDHVEELLQSPALGVEQQLAPGVQDAQVP